MATVKDNNTGFPSLYRATYEEGWSLKNTGFDYSKVLLNKMMSSYMFRNRHLKKFLEDYLSPIMVFYINKVKYLRIYYNFAVPKWYQKIN
jgi:hypothetical protein|tara:strand:+ start:160 stop:429 length:270 start_codon:yes stop_codon:yes gene_type:complete